MLVGKEDRGQEMFRNIAYSDKMRIGLNKRQTSMEPFYNYPISSSLMKFGRGSQIWSMVKSVWGPGTRVINLCARIASSR